MPRHDPFYCPQCPQPFPDAVAVASHINSAHAGIAKEEFVPRYVTERVDERERVERESV